ncbi:MAG TPA: hypothetical protein VGN42_09185 [Pirellulales bacterium]|nr:hypothetical protein [Pirellulales bacterium]
MEAQLPAIFSPAKGELAFMADQASNRHFPMSAEEQRSSRIDCGAFCDPFDTGPDRIGGGCQRRSRRLR